MAYFVDSMTLDDIPEVSEIERLSYSTSWSAQAYRRELTDNRLAHYIVLRWGEKNGTHNQERQATQPVVTSDGEGLMTPTTFRQRLSRLFKPFQTSEPAPRPTDRTSLGGYAGLWLMVDEAHITTIAVRPTLRGNGLGDMMMIALAEASKKEGAARMTLEVRVSNHEAQNLYKKFTFKEEGVRRRYYSDNNEDALIMWSEPLDSNEFQSRLWAEKEKLKKRHQAKQVPPPWLTALP